MKVTHNQLFPLTMSVYTPDYKITEQEIEFLKNVEVATEEDMEQHVHLSKNINILNTCPELKNIRDVMLSVAEEYKRDVLGISNQLAPLHNWLSKQYEGGHHHKHNHPSVLFNLVYYIYGSENAPLRIELGDSKSRLQEGYNFSFNRAKMTPFNSQGFIHFPTDGEIVCIPGWLNHGTDISKGFRMCIGWNFFINGIVGEDKYDRVELDIGTIDMTIKHSKPGESEIQKLIATRLDNDK